MRNTILSAALLILAFGVHAQDTQSEDPEREQQQTQDTQDTQYETQDTQYEDTTFEQDQAQDTQSQYEVEQTGAEQQDQATQDDARRDRMGTSDMSEPAAQDPAMQGQAGGQAEVPRSQFTREVQDKEPVDEISEVSAGEDPIFFFTEVKNAEGQTITHRWLRDGEVMAEVPLEIGSNDWRTWSSKELMPEWDGEWTVEVVDAQGNVIEEQQVRVERGQQTQRVGYSPDDQQQQDQSGQDQQDQSDQATQQETSAREDDGLQLDEGWETEDVGAEEEDTEQTQDDQRTSDQDW